MDETVTVTRAPEAAQPDWTPAREALSSKYDLIEEVGRGGFGVVWRGRHQQLDIDVAIKVMLPHASPGRFQREARTLARLESVHLVRVLDFDVLADGSPFMVMEWVDGGTLADQMRTAPDGLDQELAITWMQHSAAGLAAAEAQGIVHRDVKPSNILISHNRKARVADFGLAVDVLRPSSQDVGVMGTPLYMAPEQTRDASAVDSKADIYSLGATFFHALTGQPPFTGSSLHELIRKHRLSPLAAPTSIRSDLAPRVNDVLERCLAKAPDDRFSGFGELAAALTATADMPGPWSAIEAADVDLQPYLRAFRSLAPSFLAPASAGTGHRFELPGDRIIKVFRGRIEEQACDALVSSTDSDVTMGGGASAALSRVGGRLLEARAGLLGPARPGRVVVTSAGDLDARLIFHAIVLRIDWDDLSVYQPTRDIIAETVRACLYEADTFDVQSIAFPLLGTGLGRFPLDVCLETMFRTLARALHRGQTGVTEARIVILPMP